MKWTKTEKKLRLQFLNGKNMNVPVICINDKDRPNEVPASRWVKEGEKYHIVQIDKLNAQGGIHGVKLAEINNDDLAPYQYFRIERFGLPVDSVLEDLVVLEEEGVLL